MDDRLLRQMRSEAQEIFKSGVEAVDPFAAVRRFVPFRRVQVDPESRIQPPKRSWTWTAMTVS